MATDYVIAGYSAYFHDGPLSWAFRARAISAQVLNPIIRRYLAIDVADQ